jgi:hypothetical protein
MKIELLRAWKSWGVGHVFTDMPPNVAASLIAAGVGREQQKSPAREALRAGVDYVTRGKRGR